AHDLAVAGRSVHMTRVRSMPPSDPASASLWRFWFIFLVAFVEGGAVMAVEITGAKLVGPFYGSSLYVWAAVLALTLGGLATGYFAGGRLSRHFPDRRALFSIILVSALLVAAMPWVAPWVMKATLGMELRLGITLSALVFLFPPLACFGMVSPLIIRLISTHRELIGRATGTVYAISTLGGILVTFIVVFYAIPEIGMRETLLVTAGFLAFFPLLYFSRLARSLTG
ncbi:MAG: fused MFS/spermidine synthase, partial [Wenzhouxiangella sp.]